MISELFLWKILMTVRARHFPQKRGEKLSSQKKENYLCFPFAILLFCHDIIHISMSFKEAVSGTWSEGRAPCLTTFQASRCSARNFIVFFFLQLFVQCMRWHLLNCFSLAGQSSVKTQTDLPYLIGKLNPNLSSARIVAWRKDEIQMRCDLRCCCCASHPGGSRMSRLYKSPLKCKYSRHCERSNVSYMKCVTCRSSAIWTLGWLLKKNALPPSHTDPFFMRCVAIPSRGVHAYTWTHRDGTHRNGWKTHPCGAGLSICGKRDDISIRYQTKLKTSFK